MSLLINQLKKSEILTSYNFARTSDIVFSETLTHKQFDEIKDKEDIEIVFKNSYLIFYLRKKFSLCENDVIFTNTYFVENLFDLLSSCKRFKNIKLITHQTDIPITKKLYNKKPECISKWFSINVDYENDNLIPIPLGLANDYSPKNIMKQDFNKITKNNDKSEKLYLNFQKNTNLKERKALLKKFEEIHWAVTEKPNQEIDTYLHNLNKYKFTLSPWGNGYDTHRFWEAIYAGSIPVTKKHITYKSSEGLPVIQLSDYKSISMERLLKEAELVIGDSTLDKLNIDYWLKKIKNNDDSDKLTESRVEVKNSSIKKYINKYNRNANFENKYKKFFFRFRQVYNLPKKIIRIIRK